MWIEGGRKGEEVGKVDDVEVMKWSQSLVADHQHPSVSALPWTRLGGVS